VKPYRWLGAVLLLTLVPAGALARGLRTPIEVLLDRHRLHGTLVDYTHNQGIDRRIWSESLGQRRDLYVYLPPGYDPHRCYPLIIWLHGFGQDEQAFVHYLVRPLDDAIADGRLPPAIVAAPDGSLNGSPCFGTAGSFFVNSKAGNFEDFVVHDVYNFVVCHYLIRPEREAHVLAGVSMGGGGAYNLAMRHRDQFEVVLAIFPPLNTRWMDCHGDYRANFDPCCWRWRTDYSHRREVVGRFYGGLLTFRLKDLGEPIYGRGPDVLPQASRDNPIENLDRLNVQPGELDMYVAYGGQDQFNLDAQVESFLYRAREKGLDIHVEYDPRGKHDVATAREFYPSIIEWLRPRLEPFR
jgi:S-formylglutathione hydrolase FrmB